MECNLFFMCSLLVIYIILLSTDTNAKQISDPHFIVPLVSGDKLCFSIQGHSGLITNLIYSNNFIINALFVDNNSGDRNKPQIGKFTITPKNSNAKNSNLTNSLIFDSVKQEVVLVSQRLYISAAIIDSVNIDKTGKMSVKFTQGVTNYTDNHTVRVEYAKPFGTFNVSFHDNHLNVDWNMTCDDITDIHGLMGMIVCVNYAIQQLVVFQVSLWLTECQLIKERRY